MRLDIRAVTHPKLFAAAGGDRREALELVGFIALCGAYVTHFRSDGFVPTYAAEIVAGDQAPRLVAGAVKAGFLGRKQRAQDGDQGWPLVVDDGLFLLHTSARRASTAG